jgi:hypothetical protein
VTAADPYADPYRGAFWCLSVRVCAQFSNTNRLKRSGALRVRFLLPAPFLFHSRMEWVADGSGCRLSAVKQYT